MQSRVLESYGTHTPKRLEIPRTYLQLSFDLVISSPICFSENFDDGCITNPQLHALVGCCNSIG